METSIPEANELSTIFIRQRVGGRNALAILVGRDGSINRMGSGKVDGEEDTLFIGVTREPIFATLAGLIEQAGLARENRGYVDHYARGEPCDLTLTLRRADGTEGGVQFLYGSESQEPPETVLELVRAALYATDNWYRAQKRLAKPKRWWRFW